MSTQDALKKMARDFQAVKAAADDFVKWANEKLEHQDEETDMYMENKWRLHCHRKEERKKEEESHAR